MNERTYSIYDGTFTPVAEHMPLDVALTLLEGLFNKYYIDPRAYMIKPDGFETE